MVGEEKLQTLCRILRENGFYLDPIKIVSGINGMRFFEFGKEMGRKFSFLFGWEGKGK